MHPDAQTQRAQGIGSHQALADVGGNCAIGPLLRMRRRSRLSWRSCLGWRSRLGHPMRAEQARAGKHSAQDQLPADAHCHGSKRRPKQVPSYRMGNGTGSGTLHRHETVPLLRYTSTLKQTRMAAKSCSHSCKSIPTTTEGGTWLNPGKLLARK